MKAKFYLFLLFIVWLTGTAAAQTVDLRFNGLGFFDNREYKDFIQRSRTYSGTRLALDVGLNLDSLHHFVIGVNALHEFGANQFFVRVNPVAYYSYTGKNWLFNAGEFSREGLLSDYPRAMLNDTLRYYRPNVEGLLTRFNSSHVTETIWIDWVSRQTNTEREQFLFGLSGRYKPSLNGLFYISHYVFVLHDAGAAIPIPDDHIQDNGAVQIKLGANLSRKTFLDSLSFEAGGMMSLERVRGVDGFRKPLGFVANAYLSYKRFAIFDEFYKGDGHHITFGDAFYEKKTYNRLDIIYTPFLLRGVRGQFILSLHQTPGYSSNQEAFRISYDVGRKRLAKFKE